MPIERAKRRVDDADLYVLNIYIYIQLDKLNTTVRLMFFDFSSAFNTIQYRLLARKLFENNNI